MGSLRSEKSPKNHYSTFSTLGYISLQQHCRPCLPSAGLIDPAENNCFHSKTEMPTLHAAIRKIGIITLKRVAQPKGPDTVVAVIAPEKNDTYVLSIRESAETKHGYISSGTLSTLTPPNGSWKPLGLGPHGGKYPAGTGYFCEKGGFTDVISALKELRKIVVPGCVLDSTVAYHGTPWPIGLPNYNMSSIWP
jgi:hypothetical protein